MLAAQPLDREPQDRGATYEEPCVRRTGDDRGTCRTGGTGGAWVGRASRAWVGVQVLLGVGCDVAEGGDRVVAAGVAEEAVGGEAEQETESP